MIRATFEELNEANIGDVEVIDIGEPVLKSPAYKVSVAVDEVIKFIVRLHIYNESDCFHDLICSEWSVVVGCGEYVHVIGVAERNVISIKLNGYFGGLYSVDDVESTCFTEYVLVASSMDLICLSASGEVLWRSPPLAVDGVIVSDIVNGVIEGRGELDPPGGWEKFRLDLSNGSII